ncbi:L-lactate permease [Corynebacterium uterequi]|uniref:L-lactate permease n=1 Tax=Corynebacterium uterequi TaxID=1072256 RepID=A0A0G3HFY5_9CORY|nr:L-lactate permease [Corynebacterium uterequi]AKK10868.1 L-lactate transport [Corynebacterium uterequi]
MDNHTFFAATDAVAGSVALSALAGIVPLAAFFVFLMGFKLKAHTSALLSVVVALIVAIAAFGMPVGLSLLSLTQGVAFGLFPIVFIIWMAVWIYDLTVKSSRFEDMRVIFSKIGRGDKRVQAMLIGFAFGGLLEALAGFGAPIAIVISMLVAIGIEPLKAVIVTFVANAAPVAFGAMAIPVTTAGGLTSLDPTVVAAMAGRQLSVMAFVVPFVLCLIMDGVRGIKQCWPMAIVLGTTFGGGQFLASNFFAYELTDVVACLISLICGIGFLTVWGPKTPAEQASAIDADSLTLSGRDASLALFPYILIVVVFAITKLWRIGVDIPAALSSTDLKIQWPGLYGKLVNEQGEPITSTIFNFNWLSNPGTILFFCGVITVIVYVAMSTKDRPLSAGAGFAELFIGLNRMKLSYLTIAAVMGLAYVMNFSGQTAAIGALLAGTGAIFPLLSPMLGWLGTAVTGSATSSNALFAQMQSQTAQAIGVEQHLLVAANSAGAVAGKMVCPQTVALAAASAKLDGGEAKITAEAFKYSVGLLALMCLLVFLQSTSVLGWMVV